MDQQKSTESVTEEQKLRAQTAQAQLSKLKLEISSLKWQNSWISRLAQFAAILTITATLVTVFVTVFGLISERSKDRELRAKDLEERISKQYRTDVEHLLEYPSEEKQTIPYIVFLLNDLKSLIRASAGVKELKGEQFDSEIKKEELVVADLISKLTTSTKFDFDKPRDVEFDLRCLDNWEAYKILLRDQRPQNNLDVLGKYAAALERLYKEDPVYVGQVYSGSADVFCPVAESKFTKDYSKTIQFADLYYGFSDHVNLLKERLEQKPDDEENKKNIRRAYELLEVIHNPCLSKQIFDTLIPNLNLNCSHLGDDC
jgi:hypothetical protein